MVQPWVRAPLKVQRPFYPEGPEICHSVLLHTAGGVVGGDRLSIQLQLQPQARALITTAAASKLYRTNGLQAQQAVQVEVAEGACLEWLPQETIVFDRAHYRQTMQIDLAPGATWLGWDITRFGRTAKGERFTSGEWRSHTEVWQAGNPLWVDRQWLPGSEELINSPHGLAGCGVVGSFAFLGQSVEPELVEKARQLWTGEGEVGVTRLRSGSASSGESGLLCRYRGNSTSEVRYWFTAVWHLIRVSFLGQSACIPRVWGV
nr:urease accessory protein UreD [Leptolyngbya sp. FACHB-36]